jgi:hypothetical protein
MKTKEPVRNQQFVLGKFAHETGCDIAQNPYPDDARGWRSSWRDGWNYAQNLAALDETHAQSNSGPLLGRWSYGDVPLWAMVLVTICTGGIFAVLFWLFVIHIAIKDWWSKR